MKRTLILVIYLLLSTILLLFTCSSDDYEQVMDPTCNLELYPPGDIIITSHSSWTQKHYPKRINEFKKDSIYPNSIVMLGNSLTEQGEDWSELLNIENVKNRGISGDNTEGLAARLGEIICSEPKGVFIMIGTNDLWTDYSAIEIGKNIDNIATILAESLPEAKIYLQTIMPLEKEHGMTARLEKINNIIRAYSNRDYILVNTFKAMSDSNGELDSTLTTDGVHLTKSGYIKWSQYLKTFLY